MCNYAIIIMVMYAQSFCGVALTKRQRSSNTAFRGTFLLKNTGALHNMNRLITIIFISAVLLYGEISTTYAADSASDDVSKTAAIIVMLVAFTAAFAISAFLTYRIRMRKNNMQKQVNTTAQEESPNHDD